MPDVRRAMIYILVPILGLLMSLWLVNEIITADRNILASFMEYLGYGGLILGIFWPRAGFYFLIGISGYLDFIKRLLIVTGDLNWNEILDVLKIAPLTLCGVFVGLLIKRWIEGKFFYFHEWITFFLVIIFQGISVALSYKESKTLYAAIATTANGSVYIILLLVVSMLYKNFHSMLRMIKILVYAYVPVAIYGIGQYLFGILDFEREYLLSGYTSNIGYFAVDLFVRPFSTLNSNHGYSIVMCMMVYLAYVIGNHDWGRGQFLKRFFWIVVTSLFVVATITSFRRTSWFMLFCAMPMLFCFYRKDFTILFYLACFSILTIFFLNAKTIQDNLGQLQSFLPISDEKSEAAFRLGTFSERLKSYHNLLNNREIWSLFGKRDIFQGRNQRVLGDDYVVHDGISQTVVSYGFFGLGCIVTILSASLYYVHKITLRIEDPLEKKMAITLLALNFSNVLTGVVFQSNVAIFPVNLYFWVVNGMIFSICFRRKILRSRV